MNEEVKVVILTKSVKNGGYCVAGINIKNSSWIRLVSSNTDSHGALCDYHMRYRNRAICKLLDVVKVPILREEPTKHQPENVLIDEQKPWEKVDEFSINDVLELHPPETHNCLLGNVFPYITEQRVDTVGHSLILVKVRDLIITHPGERRTKASFLYGDTTYENMSITDPDFYYAPENKRICQAILIMSLPDTPYEERKFYKFIAKIYPY